MDYKFNASWLDGHNFRFNAQAHIIAPTPYWTEYIRKYTIENGGWYHQMCEKSLTGNDGDDICRNVFHDRAHVFHSFETKSSHLMVFRAIEKIVVANGKLNSSTSDATKALHNEYFTFLASILRLCVHCIHESIPIRIHGFLLPHILLGIDSMFDLPQGWCRWRSLQSVNIQSIHAFTNRPTP